MKNNLLSVLGLCRKAGKLALGRDAVAEACASKTASLLVCAQDLSAGSRREIDRLSERHRLPIHTLPHSMDEIWHAVGKRAGILAVTDPNLARALRSALSVLHEEE